MTAGSTTDTTSDRGRFGRRRVRILHHLEEERAGFSLPQIREFGFCLGAVLVLEDRDSLHRVIAHSPSREHPGRLLYLLLLDGPRFGWVFRRFWLRRGLLCPRFLDRLLGPIIRVGGFLILFLVVGFGFVVRFAQRKPAQGASSHDAHPDVVEWRGVVPG